MNTYNINKDKVKICLSDDEVKSLFGGYDMIDYDCPRSRAILDSLLLNALPENMLPFDCKKVLIEVMEEKNGCSIQITRIYNGGKRLHKVKSAQKYILQFTCSEDFIKFVTQAKNKLPQLKNCKLLKSGERFCLYFSAEKSFIKANSRFCEYGTLLSGDLPKAAAILEYGKIIGDADLEKISSAFNG